MLNLKQEMVNVLNKADPSISEYFISLFKVEVSHLEEIDQLKCLESFWRIQLGMMSVNTMYERTYLETDVNYKVWLNRFEKYILPSVAVNWLPK